MTLLGMLRKGLASPSRVPPYLLGKLFPDSRWGPEWRRENGYVTFEDGGFAGGSPSRPELSARIFYEASTIAAALGDRRFERSLEVGPGYGRLSGWIADRADESVAVEPNRAAIERADGLYPAVGFHGGSVDALPYREDRFDLVVTWLVLSHVPPESFDDAAAELARVLRPGGTLLVCEQTSGRPGRATWPRDRATYRAAFDDLELVDVRERGVEPTFDYGQRMETLTFEG